jgi:hypothetical protein
LSVEIKKLKKMSKLNERGRGGRGGGNVAGEVQAANEEAADKYTDIYEGPLSPVVTVISLSDIESTDGYEAGADDLPAHSPLQVSLYTDIYRYC